MDLTGDSEPSPAERPEPPPSWTLRFVTTDRVVLDAWATRGNLRLGTFWTAALGVDIVLGVLVAVRGYTLGYLLVIIGVLLFLYSYVEPVLLWRIRRRAGDSLGRELTVRIDADALRSENELGSGRIPWSTMTAVVVTDRIVAFVRGRRPVAYVPSSAFADEAERDAVIAFVRARIAAEADRGRAPTP